MPKHRRKASGANRSNGTPGPVTIPPAEWAVAAIGMFCVVAAVGLLLYEAVAGDRSAPSIGVEVTAVRQHAHGFAVEFVATNDGGSPAIDVTIHGEVAVEGGTPEASDTTLPYLGAHSRHTGGLFFTRDPARGLTIRALGYQSP